MPFLYGEGGWRNIVGNVGNLKDWWFVGCGDLVEEDLDTVRSALCGKRVGGFLGHSVGFLEFGGICYIARGIKK